MNKQCHYDYTLHVATQQHLSKLAQLSLPPLQMEALEEELEEIGRRAAQYEEEISEASQGMDLQLVDSQVYT